MDRFESATQHAPRGHRLRDPGRRGLTVGDVGALDHDQVAVDELGVHAHDACEVLGPKHFVHRRRTDVGITTGQLKANFLDAMNRALRSVGGMTVQSLDDEGALYRAMLRLEAA